MADLYITGQFNGVEGITAVSNGSQVMHMLTVIIVGLAMGTTVTVGHAIGAEKKEKAAVGIVEKIIGAIFIVPSSMLATVSALSAQNIGAGKHQRARLTLRYATCLTTGYGIICVRIPGSYLASKYFPDTLFLINEKNMQYTAKTTARKHLQTVQKCGIVSILHFYTNILDKGTDRGVSVQIEVMRSGKENVRDN